MKFAPMKEILKLAEERNVAYGAYVTVSYEMARAAIEAGNETGTPVIFITGTDCVELAGGYEGMVNMVKFAARDAQIPVWLQPFQQLPAEHYRNRSLYIKRSWRAISTGSLHI